MNIYNLNRAFWDYAFEHPNTLKPNHSAIYFYAIEHCNRLGWKENFGLPASMVMEATGINSYSVYKKIFDDLVEFGFIKVIQYSKNQFTSNIVALIEYDKAPKKATDKALDKALAKQLAKHPRSTLQSTKSINKPLNNNTNIPLNKGVDPLIKKAKLSFENNDCLFGTQFKKQWFKLLHEKKWKGKSQSAIDASLKKLMRYDEEFAQSLVENAIGGEYQGVVFSDTDANYQKYLKSKNGNSSHTTAASKDESRSNMVKLARSILSQNPSDLSA